MERRERWLSLAIFFSFYRINFRGSCDSSESQLPLFWTIYFPTAPLYNKRNMQEKVSVLSAKFKRRSPDSFFEYGDKVA